MLSGNRNFEGRVNPLVRSNYLASPPLVVAYAIRRARRYRYYQRNPWAKTAAGKDVYLRDIWPTNQED